MKHPFDIHESLFNKSPSLIVILGLRSPQYEFKWVQMAHVGVGASSNTSFPAHIIEIGSCSVHKTPSSPLLPLPALLHPHPPLHFHQLLTQPPASLLHPEKEMCFSDFFSGCQEELTWHQVLQDAANPPTS